MEERKSLIDIDEEERKRLIGILTEELPVLRAKIGLSQKELSGIVGISRQTYSAIETKKSAMSWGIFLTLVLFWYYFSNITKKPGHFLSV